MTDPTAQSIFLEIQRSLGRIEGEQKATRKEMERGFQSLRDDLGDHKNDDQRSFSSIRVSLREHDERLGVIAVANTRLQEQDENTKTIGKWVIGAFGSFVAMLGTAVVAALTGHIKIE